MTFVDSIKTCFAKYADFSGRATRSEYWFFTLFALLGYLVTIMIDPMVSMVFALAILVPSIAVTIRRLHDTDRSGWFYLLNLIPFGGLVLLFFFCQEGTPGANRFDSGPVDPGFTPPGATRPEL